MKKSLGTKCACCAGGIGNILCTIFMGIGIVGTTAVGLSKSTATAGGNSDSMNAMSAIGTTTTTITASSSLHDQIINFFTGIWGEIIILMSFGSMIGGMWFTGRWKLLPLSVAGAAVLFVGMYVYYSLALEIAGGLILAFAYLSIFSYGLAKNVKLV